MFEGYWGWPEETLKTFRNLWFHTGDLGRFDEDGFFYFVDRKKDYLRRGGENISSSELEAVFLEHPDVVEAAVHAISSDLVEDEVKLTAVPPRCRVTARLRGHAAALVAEHERTVAGAARVICQEHGTRVLPRPRDHRECGGSWPVVHEAFAERVDPVSRTSADGYGSPAPEPGAGHIQPHHKDHNW
jgi:acyl-CoA synthetase (AMP-forming)/AMP-acid ligase II